MRASALAAGTIPPQLGALSKLTDLVLSENLLGGTLPPQLGNLTSLTYLGFACALRSLSLSCRSLPPLFFKRRLAGTIERPGIAMRRFKRARAAKCVFRLEWLCVSESPASSRIAQRCDVARFLRRRIPACLHFCTADSILSRRLSIVARSAQLQQAGGKPARRARPPHLPHVPQRRLQPARRQLAAHPRLVLCLCHHDHRHPLASLSPADNHSPAPHTHSRARSPPLTCAPPAWSWGYRRPPPAAQPHLGLLPGLVLAPSLGGGGRGGGSRMGANLHQRP